MQALISTFFAERKKVYAHPSAAPSALTVDSIDKPLPTANRQTARRQVSRKSRNFRGEPR